MNDYDMPDKIGTDMLTHKFPLRRNCFIQMRLPLDLNANDIKRINVFLDAIRLEGFELVKPNVAVEG